MTFQSDNDNEPLSPMPLQSMNVPLHACWDRIMFFNQFLRDLAIHEKLTIKQCLKFYEKLSTDGLFALLELLTEVNRECARCNSLFRKNVLLLF